MSSLSFLAKVGRELGLKDTPAGLQGMVDVESIFSESRDRAPTRGVKITVRTDDPKKSAALVEAIMEAAVAEHDELYEASWQINYDYLKKTELDIARTKEQIELGYAEVARLTNSGRVNQVEMSYLASYVEEKESYVLHLEEVELDLRQKLLMGIYTHPTRIIVEPIVPTSPAGPHRVRIVLLALIVSFALGVIIAFFFDWMSGDRSANQRSVAGEDEKKKVTPVAAAPEPAPAAEPIPEPEAATPPPPASNSPPPDTRPVRPAEVRRLTDEHYLTLSDFIKLLRSQAWVVGITLVLGLTLGVVYALVKPREYRADFVISTGIVGDHWIHSPMLIEEQCQSRWFLFELSKRLNRKYDVFELEDMVEAELIMTPTKGLTRELRISVKADTPEDCYALATNLAALLEETDRDVYEGTHEMFNSYLGDLETVMGNLTSGAAPAEPAALAPRRVHRVPRRPSDVLAV
jgi:hypothetical protein